MARQKESPPRGIRQTSLGAMGIVRTPIKKGTHTPSSSAKKKATRSGAAAASPSPRHRIADGGKYGFCPRCVLGRRMRAPFDQRGNPLNKGKFRFICSHRKEGPGCDYMEILDFDPAENPGLYKAASPQAPQAKGDEEEDEELEQEDEDDAQIVGQSKLAKFAMAKKGLSTPTRKLFGDKNPIAGKKLFGDNSPTAGKKLLGNNVTPGKKLFGDNSPTAGNNNATPGKDTPQKKVGCPQCITGRLTEKIKSTFFFTQTILVCEKVFDPQTRDVFGGCGYTLDMVEEDFAGNGNGGSPGPEAKNDKPKNAKELELEKKELDELVAAEREKARANPNAAVVMAGPVDDKPKKKVLVDLTEDDEMLGLPPSSGPSVDTMVGAQAPIVIDDDDEHKDDKPKDEKPKGDKPKGDKPKGDKPKGNEPNDAADFDDFDSNDEMELVRISDEARAKVEDMDDQDELEFMELTDKVEASQR